MPFGQCLAWSYIEHIMDIALGGLQLEICLIYLDDIIIDRMVEETLERVRKVLNV